MKKIFYLFTLVFLFTLVACEQDLATENLEAEDLKAAESNINGNWTVNAYMGNELMFGPFTITTQITAKNDSLFLRDEGKFWNFQTRAALDPNNQSFVTASSINELSNLGANIKVLNGTVINTDSISFDIQFEDDETPYGITYSIKGRRK